MLGQKQRKNKKEKEEKLLGLGFRVYKKWTLLP